MNRYLFFLLLAAAFCATDLAAQAPGTLQSGVQTTFFLQLDLERGYVLCPTGTGNLYLAGMQNVDMVLIEMTAEGVIVSSRYIDVGNFGVDAISQMIVDSDGQLVVTGNTAEDSPGNGYVFRYNPALRKTVWAKIFGAGQSLAMGVLENGPGGNFLVYANPHDANGDDAEFFQIDRNTGNMVPGSAWRYNYGSFDDFHSMALHAGALYATGRFSEGNAGSGGWRNGLTRINPNTGTVDWIQLGHAGPNQFARLFGRDLVVEGADIISTYSGNDVDDTSGISYVYLQKNTTTGTLVWRKKYDLTEWPYEFAEEIVSVPDGYVLYGRTLSGDALFMFKTNRSGQLLWARKIEHNFNNAIIATAQGQIVAMGDFTFATGFSDDMAGVNRSFVLKADAKGSTSPSCSAFVPTPVVVSDVANDATYLVTPVVAPSPTILLDMPVAPPVNFIPQKQVICQQVVDDCSNLPNTHFPDTVICPGETLTYSAPGYSNYIWAPAAGLSCTTCPTVNAAPQTTTTYTLFASDANGCELRDTFVIQVRPYTVLNLGPDVILCSNKTVVFDAGPNFAAYLWQDGSSSPTLTPVDPGTYWVQVTDLCERVQRDSVFFSFSLLPDTRFGDTVICPGNSVMYSLNGFTTYAWAPAKGLSCTSCPTVTAAPQTTTTYTLFAQDNNGCELRDTFTVAVLSGPSSLKITCPPNLTVQAVPGSQTAAVTYADPVINTNCPCDAPVWTRTQGLANGASFPLGQTQVCFTAEDGCNTTSACCFAVTVLATPAPGGDPCDVKETPCLRFEILGISQNAQKQKTYRMRVINKCSSELMYVAYQLPNGMTAKSPANGSIYTSPSGRQYEVRNAASYQSVRFKTIGTGIANGQSDIFEYTLPAQADPVYIHVSARLVPQVFVETHLNVFGCVVQQQTANRPEEAADRSGLQTTTEVSDVRLFPNPVTDRLHIDLAGWQDQTVRLFVADALGRVLLSQPVWAMGQVYILELPQRWPSGVYTLTVSGMNGARKTERFMKR